MTAFRQNAKQTAKDNRWILIVSGCLILIVLGCYFFVTPFHAFIDEAVEVLTSDDKERIEKWVQDFGWWGPVLIIGLMTAQMFLIVIPSFILMVASVLVYGRLWGALLAIVAVLVASTIGYYIGRALGAHTITRLLGERKERRVRKETDRYGLWAVVIARLSPLFSNDAISIIAGLLQMGFPKFILATLGGIVPLAALTAAFGKNTETMKTGLIWITAFSIIGLAAKIIYDKRINRREAAAGGMASDPPPADTEASPKRGS
ncbi:MAG: TVP38/TMEM64 family protein [Opitutales bacterium]